MTAGIVFSGIVFTGGVTMIPSPKREKIGTSRRLFILKGSAKVFGASARQ